MIVDCEMYHHGPDGSVGGQAFGIEQLEELCRAAGVDKAVLMPAPTFYPRNQLVAEVLNSTGGTRGGSSGVRSSIRISAMMRWESWSAQSRSGGFGALN